MLGPTALRATGYSLKTEKKPPETRMNFKKDVKIEGTNSISPLASIKVSKKRTQKTAKEREKRAEIAQKSQNELYLEPRKGRWKCSPTRRSRHAVKADGLPSPLRPGATYRGGSSPTPTTIGNTNVVRAPLSADWGCFTHRGCGGGLTVQMVVACKLLLNPLWCAFRSHPLHAG